MEGYKDTCKINSIFGQGMALREAQDALIAAGEKKNAVKQAAIELKKMFETS